VSAFLALVGAGFRRYATYRQATWAGAFTNTVFGVVKVSILFAAAEAAGGAVAGYDRAALSTYTWVSQGLIAVVFMFQWNVVVRRVKSGDVAIDLGRPVSPITAWLAEDLGRAGQACLVRFVVPMVAGGLLFGLRAPDRWATVPLFLASMVAAVLTGFAARLLMSLTAFWVVDARGVVQFYTLFSTALSGLLAPVHFLPGWAQVLAWATPFPMLIQVPTDIAVERSVGLAALGLLGLQLAWAAGLLLLARWVFDRGTRRLVVQGG
jgi:ABC-2 type transport system permease protein